RFLSSYYGQEFVATTSEEEYAAAEEGKINYTLQPLPADTLWMEPQGLLFDKGVRRQAISVFQHPNGYKAFYRAHGHLGFDLFSALFFLLTRYEEYGPHSKDAYCRYAHQNSTAYKEGFLHLPLINIWLEDFRKVLQLTTHHSPLTTSSFQPTYDIDIAWSYKNKDRWVTAGGVAKSLLKGDFRAVKERRAVIDGAARDPYDSYAYMDVLHRQYGLQPIYFIHVGQKRNRYDKNIHTANPEFRKLVQSLAAKYQIGLHPSWASNSEPHLLATEKGVLEEIIGKPVTLSRQHFIRWELPQTFRRLLALGITDDYSMGYGSINGFRASIATPYYWYDIEREEQTSLLLHPFAFMDANALFEQKQTPQQSLKELLFYYHAVRETGGTLTTIWHNTFLGTDPLFRGWGDVYGQFLHTTLSSAKTY
ncbi:MAG TPA: polysaccharide deacetylase family protein, partial [Chitinophagaceae bacterium]